MCADCTCVHVYMQVCTPGHVHRIGGGHQESHSLTLHLIPPRDRQGLSLGPQLDCDKLSDTPILTPYRHGVASIRS